MTPWHEVFLSGYQWYRRWRGGHWERWYIDHPVCADIWFRNWPHGKRPGLGRGRPICEEW